MFPTIGETRFSASTNGGTSSFHYNNFPLAVNGHRSLSEEEQHLYNHHIIENFVESAREMNEVVLIPSKLQDLDPSATSTTDKYVVLNDDLYSYYQMINIVKNDLFEPHNDDSRKLMLFSAPKRKISRREQTQKNGHNRNVSATNLAAMLGNYPNGNNQSSGRTSPDTTPQSNGVGSTNGTGETSPNGTNAPLSPAPTSAPLLPLTSDQLIGQNSKQLTVQFIHHLHSLYTILDHFTSAADFITERYQKEVESSM